MGDRSETLRRRFAHVIATSAGARDPRIEAAFAAVPRETFAGPPPWIIVAGGRYVDAPDDDPASLYQDCLVAIDAARGINMGQPSLHAMCLDALAPQEGETVVHVGAGVGYYTAIIARLVGPRGKVFAYEIDEAIAARARKNLAAYPNVVVEARSGIGVDLPKADIVYVNAAAIEPYRQWREALRPGGRLLFPLESPGEVGAMLLITRPANGGAWPAKVIADVSFIPCEAPRDTEAARRLSASLAHGGWRGVHSLRTGAPDETCWLAGDEWWLSTAAPD